MFNFLIFLFMETKNFLDELLTNDVFVKNSNGKKSSIYKRELFNGMLDDDKKKLRRKLRKTLQNKFLATFLTIRKNEVELKKLSKIWNDYANKVYNNINVVCEYNTDLETQKLIKQFLEAMNNVAAKTK
nr:MAG TPA: hypothetical protein [Caudoviricetes sp.]